MCLAQQMVSLTVFLASIHTFRTLFELCRLCQILISLFSPPTHKQGQAATVSPATVRGRQREVLLRVAV